MSTETELFDRPIPVKIEEEIKNSYLDYAMSVIIGRALPDARDGLKPVHRRSLYSMYLSGNHWNRGYKKSARIVGDVMGKFHPHGDQAIYDTVVRLAQDFSMRYPLVDGQGNFGSIDGDAPAAMRYTEIRMAKLAHSLVSDIEKNTVDFVPNYDGEETEPVVLPTVYPNLLINGSSGIAVGMATNIPPPTWARWRPPWWPPWRIPASPPPNSWHWSPVPTSPRGDFSWAGRGPARPTSRAGA